MEGGEICLGGSETRFAPPLSNIAMPDSQRYLRNLYLIIVGDIVVFLGLNVFTS